jgi:hypothetical protein
MICGWMDGMWCGKASRQFGSRTWVQVLVRSLELDLVFKPGSKNETWLGFYFGLMRIGTSNSNWPSQVTAQHWYKPSTNKLLVSC